MENIKHILVVMEPTTDHQPALTQALKIAKQSSASIELFVAAYNSNLVSHFSFDKAQSAAIQNEYIASKKRWLKTYTEELAADGIKVKTDVVWHPELTRAILEKVANTETSLVVKSTKQNSKLKKLFFTPSDWKLLEYCSVPLLLTKNITDKPYNAIMAAVGSENNHDKPELLDDLVLKTSINMASLLESKVHVSHCYQPISIELWKTINQGQDVNDMGFEDYNDAISHHHKKMFTTLLKDYPFNEQTTHLVQGPAGSKLPKLVNSENVDLLVMGMANNGQYIGNLVEEILDNVDCDILSLRALENE